jgi:muconate cycloisomerase
MKIADIRLTPLFCRFKQPYVWAQGVNEGTEVILDELLTEKGIVGIGESVASPGIGPVLSILEAARERFIGQPVHDSSRLTAEFYRWGFNARGTGSAPRYYAEAMTGIDLALWDAIGKAAGLPLHSYWAAAREASSISACSGHSANAHHARALVPGLRSSLKVGRGEIDVANARGQKSIGNARLRLANGLGAAARRTFDDSHLDISSSNSSAQRHRPARTGGPRANTTIPIASDQANFSPEEVYHACRIGAADVITLGLHETLGITRYRKAAAIAEAAGLNLCIHGVFETGITTSASNQVAATLANMDDGNQIMWQLLAEDIVKSPDLTPRRGALPISDKPGLGFELDRAAVRRAAAAHKRRKS